MENRFIDRRKMLITTVMAGAASVLSFPKGKAAAFQGKTPPLSQAEITMIDDALGKRGNYNKDESVHTVSLPRYDLGKITIKGETVPIAFGFGGWVSFKNTMDGKSTVLMSDTVLLEQEVNPLISAVHENGLEVGAIHNHFFYENPRMVYMHIHGTGSVEDLAKKFAATIKGSKINPKMQPEVSEPIPTAKGIFNLPELDEIVKTSGKVLGQVYKYTVGRDDLHVMAMGAEMTSAIGLNSWASFAGTKENAHIAGDIAMLEHEVNSVIKVLREHKLEVVAVHNHMLGENPRIIFLHYYGRGNATTLARGFRSALDVLGKGTSTHKH